ncbi:hypothetical protein JCM5353_002866 [Sporobolomyces roseus]
MLTSTVFVALTYLLTLSASAAPLDSRSTKSVCSPLVTKNFSTTIEPAFYTGASWNYIGANKGGSGDYTTITDIREMNPVPTGVHLNISQWHGASDQYRINIGKRHGVETCLGGRNDKIYAADCASPVAAWTISCSDCNEYNGHPQGVCRFQATRNGGCATFTDFDKPMNLTNCLPLFGDKYYQDNQQFIF